MNQILALIFFMVCDSVEAQVPRKIESLDIFFAGIPLKQSYDKWVKYIVEDSTLTIDSAKPRGLYSSFKPGKKTHFPFPDSIPVKLLIQTGLTIDDSKRFPTDTIRVVMIEGIFEDSEKGKKDAEAYLKVITAMLKPHYKSHDQQRDKTGTFATFWDGKNRNWPELDLECSYYEEGHFYYIILRCEFSLMVNYEGKRPFN